MGVRHAQYYGDETCTVLRWCPVVTYVYKSRAIVNLKVIPQPLRALAGTGTGTYNVYAPVLLFLERNDRARDGLELHGHRLRL